MTVALPVLAPRSFAEQVPDLRAAQQLATLQINIGLVCNLACRHCHVESSPKRDGIGENMSGETARKVLDWLAANPSVEKIDVTGGSPEMNPHYRDLVLGARSLGLGVMHRSNPTVLGHETRNGQRFEWVPAFLAENRVEVVASLPCYQEANVEHQRGRGSYSASVEGLLRLNDVGYGSDPELPLYLVYNPGGPFLPPPQDDLGVDYHRELKERFGIVFNELWTLTNMPIKRWRADLERQGQLDGYMDLLAGAFNPSTVDGLMCRHQIHIDSQGRLHDCDFNYALDLRMEDREGAFLWETTAEELAERRIVVGDHCYGCTAGAGSSCGGSLA
ncbi:MAG: arsenosugar biosynthesis radical SAM (seleno)protein ArsS [Acidobacteriota bacterium]